MPIVVSTKDCTALSDAELVEMADLCADRPPGFDIGYLSKEREGWVLITLAREGNKLRGYSFCTLERIGGTPSLLVGLALDDRTFILKGDGSVAGGIDFFAPKVKLPDGVDGHFGGFDAQRGARLVAFG